jgi:hypothetical protein
VVISFSNTDALGSLSTETIVYGAQGGVWMPPTSQGAIASIATAAITGISTMTTNASAVAAKSTSTRAPALTPVNIGVANDPNAAPGATATINVYKSALCSSHHLEVFRFFASSA